MSEQRRAIAKLEFPRQGVAMGYYAGPIPSQGEVIALNEGEKSSGVSSVPPSVMLGRILKTNTDEILAEYDQHLFDDWERRFHEANRINSELGDLSENSL